MDDDTYCISEVDIREKMNRKKCKQYVGVASRRVIPESHVLVCLWGHFIVTQKSYMCFLFSTSSLQILESLQKEVQFSKEIAATWREKPHGFPKI